jgi:hydroxymethylpyrimidine/phosphomethylpyrimidine kinase
MVATVLVFAGLDPSGGAGLAADIAAIGALGAHALPVATALTVQDNERVYDVAPVDTSLVLRQAEAVAARFIIGAVKIGIPGNRMNALAIAALVARLRAANPSLPVVLDPVLASGHGDALGQGDAGR